MRLLRSKGALFNVRADFQYIAPVASKSYARFKSCQNWVKNNHHASLVLIRHGFCTKFQYSEAFCSFSLVYLQIVAFNFAVNSTKINPFSASKYFFNLRETLMKSVYIELNLVTPGLLIWNLLSSVIRKFLLKVRYQ